ncbi:hypothetical protein Tco_0464198, partial [Tanacetum coccineum]
LGGDDDGGGRGDELEM